MANHYIKFYPVGNGDTSLIKLDNNITIEIDCQIREKDEDLNGNKIFKVKDDILNSTERIDKKPYIDVFILSHPDQDHCLGFESHFLCNKPFEDYDKQDEEDQKIIIGELWVTSKVFSTKNCKCCDSKAIRKEALRRKKLYDDDNKDCGKFGNKLVIVGYDGEEKLEKIPHYYPGDKPINELCNKSNSNFEIFIHAPFKKDLDQASEDKNNTSIVFQARFKNSAETEFGGRVLFGGDSDHYVWEKIKTETEKRSNQNYLDWDLLLAPHHCSWSFFNDRPYEDKENQTPRQSSIDIISDKYRQEGAYIIASCNKIKDEKPNPPHYAAKTEYLKEVDSEHFINSAITPKEKEPKPIWFEYIGKDEGFEFKKRNIDPNIYVTTTRTQRAG